MLVTRRYYFSASHRLHSPALSDDANRELYGKCNYPYGHGHNYELEVTVRGPVAAETGKTVNLRDLDRLVRQEVTDCFDHRNLNEEVPEFLQLVPTTENLALVIERRLRRAWDTAFEDGRPEMERIRIYETPRNIFEIKSHERNEKQSSG